MTKSKVPVWHRASLPEFFDSNLNRLYQLAERETGYNGWHRANDLVQQWRREAQAELEARRKKEVAEGRPEEDREWPADHPAVRLVAGMVASSTAIGRERERLLAKHSADEILQAARGNPGEETPARSVGQDDNPPSRFARLAAQQLLKGRGGTS